MLGVEDGLVEQRGDVVVVQRVDDLAPDALADDQPEVTQQAQLVGDRRASISEVDYLACATLAGAP